MKSLHTWAALLLTSCAILPSSAEIIGAEDFSYPDNTTLPGNAGGFGWDWNNLIPAHSRTNSDWANVGSSPLVIDGKLRLSNASTRREYNGPDNGVEEDEGFGAIRGGTTGLAKDNVVYFRVDVTQDQNVSSSRITSYDFGERRVYFEIGNGSATIAEVGQGVTTDSNVNLPTGISHTLVAKIDFANDLMTFWVNPNIDEPEPTANLFTRPYTATNWSTSIELTSFGSGTSEFDELVVATRWEDLRTMIVSNLIDEEEGLGFPADGSISLREAIATALPGTNIVFDNSLGGGTIVLTEGELSLNRSVSIEAPARGITIDANQSSKIMLVFDGAEVELTSLNLTGGVSETRSGGAISNINSELTLNGCALYNNSAARFGGAIHNFAEFGESILTLNNCTFSKNSALEGGGAIFNQGRLEGNAEVFFNFCTISQNFSAATGGAVACLTQRNSGTSDLILTNTIIAGNQGTNNPDLILRDSGAAIIGAILASSYEGVDLSKFTDNPRTVRPFILELSDPGLAPLANYGGPTLTMHPLTNSSAIMDTPASNRVDQRGFRFDPEPPLTLGAVQVGPIQTVFNNADSGPNSLREALIPDTTLGDVTATVVRFNPALDAATITLTEQLIVPSNNNGLFVDASSLPNGLTIDANAEDDDNRRAMFVFSSATAAFHGITFTGGNLSSGNASGGAIYINGQGGTSLSLSSCLISGNKAIIGGGITSDGSFDGDALLSLHASTVSGNSASFGGGIVSFGESSGQSDVLLVSSTVTNNTATEQGGGILSGSDELGSALLTLENSILAGNFSPSRPDLSEFGGNGITRTSVIGTNLLSSLQGSRSLANNTSGIIVGDPLLAPLANNGGPTLTQLPKVGSPVIDAAGDIDPGGLDQRGLPRFVDGMLDIGAVELQGRFTEFNADGDGDGASNGLELAIGSDPQVADSENPANLFLEPLSRPSTPILQFGVNLSEQDDIILSLKRSSNLIDFDQTIISNEETNFDSSLVRVANAGIFPNKAFYRLEAEPRP